MPAWVTPLESDGSPHEGVIGTSEDQDYFRFEVTELAEAVVYTTGSVDTVGTILDSEGRQIASNDDDGEEGSNFETLSVLRPGEYFLQVTVPFELSAATYTLWAEGRPALPGLPSLTALPRTGESEGPDDVNIYHVNVHELAEVVFYTTGGLHTAGLLFGPGGRVLTGAVGEQEDFRLSTLIWPGDYYLVMGASSVGSYELHVEGTTLNPVPMTLGDPPQGGAIDAPRRADYFRIAVPAPTAAAIYSGGGLDTAAKLDDPDGREVASNDDGGTGFVNFRISAVLFRPGDYLLQVFSSSGSAGTYTLFAEGTP